MKLVRKLFKISISETIIFLVFMLVAISGITILFSLIMGNPILSIDESQWIILIGFPFVYAIIQTSINRNGVLQVTGYKDLTTLIKQIESLILKKGFIATESNKGDIKYSKKSKWGRFFNYFLREDIIIRTKEDKTLIFAKRNILVPIEIKLKYNTTN